MRNKLVIALIAIAMMTVALPTAVTQVNPSWEDPDGWGADNYKAPEPNFGDQSQDSFDYDDSKTWQEAPTLEVLDPDEDGEWEDRIYYDFVLDTRFFESIPGYQDPSNDLNTRNYPTTTYYSFLGFWRDCNGDSFMGDLDTMRMQYPYDDSGQTNAVDTGLCPAPGDADFDDRDRFFNDGTQIREFVPIGPNVRDLSTGTDDEVVLCPDRNGGPGEETSSQGGTNPTPRSNESSFAVQGVTGDGGGDNVYCDGERVDWIQDDYASVWMQLLFPESPAKPTGTICVLCHDGTYRDTNGFFRWVDSNMLGAISSQAFGLWPSENQPGTSATTVSDDDPDPGAQCDQHKDPVFGPNDPTPLTTTVHGSNADTDHGGGDDTYQDQGTAVSNAQAFAGDVSVDPDPNKALPGCSPVPNWAYVTMPVLGPVAYPGHLAEDRLNSSEDQGSMSGAHPGILGEPFYWNPGGENHCQLNEDPSSWDGEDDGDPVGAWDSSSPTELQAYYGPEDTGPSLAPTWRSIESAATWQVEHAAYNASGGATASEEPECESDGGLAQLEAHSPTAQDAGLKGPGSTYPGGFASPTGYNPARDAGVGSNGGPTDTELCTRTGHGADAIFVGDPFDGGEASRGLRCSAVYIHGNFIDVPNEKPLIRSAFRTDAATGYADVSFGDGTARAGTPTPGPWDPSSVVTFDTAGDGPFNKSSKGIYDATNPPGWSSADAWTQTLLGINPDAALPGGNDAHSYGGEGCAPSSSDATGFRNQDLGISELPSDPVIYDAKEKTLLTSAPTGSEFTLPDSGQDYLIEPESEPSDPSSSFWLCDRAIWTVAAGITERITDLSSPTGETAISACNLWVWNDGNENGTIEENEISPKHEEACFNEVIVGDPYDLRDFECHDWDAGQDTYDTMAALPQPVPGTLMGENPDDENLYFDCDTPHTGVPAP